MENDGSERQSLLSPRSRSRHSTSSKAESDHSPSILWRIAPSVFLVAFAASITTTTYIGIISLGYMAGLELISSFSCQEIIRHVACQIWYLINDPDAIPADGNLPDDMCRLGQRNSPEAYFTMFLTIYSLATGLARGCLFPWRIRTLHNILNVSSLPLDFFSSSAIAKFSNSWGRKPVYVILCSVDASAAFLLAVCLTFKIYMALYLLLFAVTISLFAGEQ